MSTDFLSHAEILRTYLARDGPGQALFGIICTFYCFLDVSDFLIFRFLHIFFLFSVCFQFLLFTLE